MRSAISACIWNARVATGQREGVFYYRAKVNFIERTAYTQMLNSWPTFVAAKSIRFDFPKSRQQEGNAYVRDEIRIGMKARKRERESFVRRILARSALESLRYK